MRSGPECERMEAPCTAAREDYPMSVGLGWCYPDPSPTGVCCVSLFKIAIFYLHLFMFYFLAAPRGLQDLSSRPRDPGLLQWKAGFLTLDLQGRPLITIFKNFLESYNASLPN